MLYDLEVSNLPSKRGLIPVEKRLLKEILGYTDTQIDIITNKVITKIATKLSKEQIKLIYPPFKANGIIITIDDPVTGHVIDYEDLFDEYPDCEKKEHYYDMPVIGKEHLIDPKSPLSNTKKFDTNKTPTVTCPYCKSTNTKKIGTVSRSFSFGLFGFGSSKVGKQWHCNQCGSDF